MARKSDIKESAFLWYQFRLHENTIFHFLVVFEFKDNFITELFMN
jgi:hypothetical protein